MKKLYILLICIFYLSSYSFAENIYDLVGKTIILPTYRNMPHNDCVYVGSVLQDFKFKNKFLTTDTILGVPLYVNEIIHINETSPKSEAYLIVVERNNNKYVFHFPRRYNFSKKKEANALSIKYLTVQENVALDNVNSLLEDIHLYHYDASMLDSLSTRFSNDSIRIIREEGVIGHRLRNSGNFPQLCVYRNYSFDGFFNNVKSYASKEDFYFKEEGLNPLYARFSGFDKYNFDIEMPIKPDGDFVFSRFAQIKNSDNLMSLSELFDCIKTLPECRQEYIDSLPQNLLEVVNNDFVGHEFYVSSAPSYTTDSNGKDVWPHWKSDFYTLSDLELTESTNNKYGWQYFYYLTNEDGKRFRCPLYSNISDNLVPADVRRQEIAERQARDEQIERERQEAIDADNLAYERDLIRRFGKTNAKIILNEEIRLGFTKAMVQEAWGSPYETTTVTNYNGTVECWIYGIGTYVYFSGNKVIQIVN